MAFKCDMCDKEFNTQEGLNQHKADKHGIKHEKKDVHKEHEHKRDEEIGKKVSNKEKRNKAIKFVVIFVAAFLVGYGVYTLATATPISYTPFGNLGDRVLGADNATVTITEFSDFQCPFCGDYTKNTEPQIISDYVDTGKVKIVYKHFPLNQIHQFAQKAAEASECAGDQNKFWEYHDVLFQNQNALTRNELKRYAASLGLNTTAFNACLDSSALESIVRQNYNEGVNKGVTSTPTFFVNNVKISGSQSFSTFKTAIDVELAK